MWLKESQRAAYGEAPDTPSAKTLLDKIGWAGLFLIVWRSTPLPLRIVALPYGLITYRRLLAASYNAESLRSLHAEEYQRSLVFRLLRPRYREVEHLLEARAATGQTHKTGSHETRQCAPQPPSSAI